MIYKRVRLDATPICQLKCPSCSTGTGENVASLGRGTLSAENFSHFLSLNPDLKNVELSNYGEAFLNPDLGKIFKIAYEKGVSVTAKNGINLNTCRKDILEDAVKYKVKYLNVSIDGASQDTYPIYRVNGRFDKVIEHIKIINKYKELYSSDLPELSWQFVVFGHNEHELPLAKKMAESLGMVFKPKMSWDEISFPIRDPEFVKLHTGWKYATRSEALAVDGVNHNAPVCKQLWDEPQVNWDGRVFGCCVNHWQDFGINAFELGLRKALRSDNFKYAKKMVRGKAPAKDGIPCSTCSVYKNMRRTGVYLDRKTGGTTRISALNIT